MPRYLKEDAWMIGTDSICSWYRNICPANAPYFSVWLKRQLKFSYDGNTITGGEKMLRDNLQPAEDTGMNAVLTLRLHKKVAQNFSISDKSPYWASMDFKLCEGDEITGLPYGYYPHQMGGTSEIDALKARITALESEQGGSGGGGLMGAVNDFLRSDHLQPVIATAIQGIISKVAPGIMPAPQMAHAGPIVAPAVNGVLSGDEVTQRLYEALEALEKADPNLEDDLTTLARIARDNPPLFQMLLNQLRQYEKA